MSYLCAWWLFSSLVSWKLLICCKNGWGHVIPTENAGGVLKVVDKEEKVVVAKEVADRILGSSVLIIGSSSYLRYWRPLRKVTPTSISMERADLKKNYEIVLNFSWIVYFRSRCQRFEVSLICFAKDRAQVLSTRPTFLSFVLLRNMKSHLQ